MNSEGWVVSGWFLLVTAAVWLVFCLVRWRTELPRCQRCGYDLTGTDEGKAPSVCPECGSPPKTGRVRYRTPRRWRRALLALIPALPASQMVCFQVRPDTAWTRWVPTSVLVWSAGEFDFGPSLDRRDAAAWMHVALMRRAPNMWRWQLRAWLGSPAMQALDNAHPPFSYRKVWPRGEPVTLFPKGGEPTWTLFPMLGWQVFNTPVGMANAEVRFNLARGSGLDPDWGLRIAHQTDEASASISWSYAPGRAMAPFPPDWFDDVATTGASSGGITQISGTIRLPTRPILRGVRRVKSLDEAITPVTSPTLNDLVRTHSRNMPGIQVIGSLAGFNGLLQSCSKVSTARGWPADVAFSPSFSLRFRDREFPLKREPTFHQGCSGPTFEFTLRDWNHDPEVARAIRAMARGERSARQGWTLIVRGDGLDALRGTESPKYWAGCVELPLGR